MIVMIRWILRLDGTPTVGWIWMKHTAKELYAPHPLEPALRNAVADLLKQNKAESWLTLAWINAQFPENNAESVKLMEALFASPAFATLSSEARFGARSWFREKAMTPAQFAQLQAADPQVVCKDLLALPKDADAATTVAALGKAIDGIRKSPVWFEIQGLEKLAAVSDEVFADAKVQSLCVEIADSLRSFAPTQEFGNRFLAEVSKTERSRHPAAHVLLSVAQRRALSPHAIRRCSHSPNRWSTSSPPPPAPWRLADSPPSTATRPATPGSSAKPMCRV